VVAADSAEFMALNAGRGLLYRGVVATVQQTIDSIMAVTPSDIAQVAQWLAPNKLSTLTYH